MTELEKYQRREDEHCRQIEKLEQENEKLTATLEAATNVIRWVDRDELNSMGLEDYETYKAALKALEV